MMNLKTIMFMMMYTTLGLGLFGQIRIKGLVVDKDSGEPIEEVRIYVADDSKFSYSDAKGRFIFSTVFKGGVKIMFKKEAYETMVLPLTLARDQDIGKVGLTRLKRSYNLELVSQINQDELASENIQTENISAILKGGKDVFSKTAAYDFGSNFYRPRFLGAEHGNILLNGVRLNKIDTGRPEWSNWGGLNDALRQQEAFAEMQLTSYGLGAMAKSINMMSSASSQKSGIKLSIALANKTYQHRYMLTYASGLLKNDWAFMLSASTRFAKEGFRQGTDYKAYSFLASLDKKLGDRHFLNSTLIYAYNKRGKSAPLTQEVFDLKSSRYNPYWGFQLGQKRNSRNKELCEPIIQLNHSFIPESKFRIDSHLTYQFGTIASSRLDYGGRSLVYNSQLAIGGGTNPDPTYYQKLPSYFLRNADNPDYTNAYLSEKEFKRDGQVNWRSMYESNSSQSVDKNAIYAQYADTNKGQSLSLNSNLSYDISNSIKLQGSLSVRNFKSDNYAILLDLLGANGFLDIDPFVNNLQQAQSDLQNLNRVVEIGDKYKYYYKLKAAEYRAFLSAYKRSKKIDFYFGFDISLSNYQRIGQYENGSNKGESSLGKSKRLDILSKSLKLGFSHRFTGRHIIMLNGNYIERPPAVNDVFSNIRVSNESVKAVKPNRSYGVDFKYIWRHPLFYLSTAVYFLRINRSVDTSFYYADGISGLEDQQNSAYVQEILIDSERENKGIEFAIEARLIENFKFRGVAAVGKSVFVSNPNLYLTSNSINGTLDLGKSQIRGYQTSSGPQRSFSLGFEYSSPNYWWLSSSLNYFDNSYISIAPITRTQNFYLDSDGLPIFNVVKDHVHSLFVQKALPSFMTLNVVGGKSWKIKNCYLGFFTSINNLANSKYKTGGFEQSRKANYDTLLNDKKRDKPLFAPKYWFSFGTTFFSSIYFRI